MATTKIIIATVPKTDKIKTLNMLQTSRKTEILQQMAAAADARLGLQPVKHTLSLAEKTESSAPRKRQRLTHLTPEEKMNRRKLKNRVAAQTARDRKKAQVDDMEANIAILEARNKQLQLENTLLRTQNQSLLEENQQLKARLEGKTEETSSVVVLDHGYCMDTTTDTPSSTTTTTVPSSEHHPMKKEVDVGSPESAAGVGPTLPQLPGHDADLESDELLGLLGHLNQVAASGTIQFSLARGTVEPTSGGAPLSGNQEGQAGQQPDMVGPTAAELESIKELIQFDHEYLKPVLDAQSNGAGASAAQSDSVMAMQSNGSTDEAHNVTDSPSLQAIRPMEVELDRGCTVTQTGNGLDILQSFKTEEEEEMDLLLSMGTDSSPLGEFAKSNVLNSDTALTCDLKELVGLISSKDCDSHSMSGKSDFGSGSDSGISDAPRSPFSDDGGLGSPGLGDGLWEESFTDLFPSLEF